MTLFEIDGAIEEFFNENIDPETGELLNIEQLDELQMAREQKIENICLFVKNLEAEADAIRAEEKTLADRRKAKENKAKRLREYIAFALDGKKFETPKVAVGYRKSVSVSIPDETVIADEYCNFTVLRKPDKTMIKNALSAGKDIHGAELVEKQNLQIK